MSIAFDGSGNLVVGGGENVYGQNAAALLLRYDAGGNLLSSRSWGNAAGTVGNAVLVDPAGNVYLGGSAANNIAQWQNATGVSGTETGTLSAQSSATAWPNVQLGSPSGTVTSPTAVIDTGGGGTDALLIRTTLAAGGSVGPPPPPQTLVGNSGGYPVAFTSEPINTATGNYYLSSTDLSVPGTGIGFIFSRTYNSMDSYKGPFGAGWTHSYNIILTIDKTTGNVAIKQGDGHQDFYSPTGSGSYAPQVAGLFNTLRQNADTSFTLTRKDQTRFNFSSAGRLMSIVDRNGNIQAFSYGGSGNLAFIADSSGRTFGLATDTNDHITRITDPIGRSWQYSYDGNGNLVSVRDPAGTVTQYGYDANHRMVSAIDPRGVTFLQNTYDGLGRVATQTNGRGLVTTLAYNSPAAGTTTFTDPLGNATQHVYDSSLRLIQVIDAKGGTVSYTYNANNNRISVTNQNGNTTTLAYDSQGNATSITDALGNIQAFTYDPQNDLLTYTNPKGATRTFFTTPRETCSASAMRPATRPPLLTTRPGYRSPRPTLAATSHPTRTTPPAI